jgi:hypothetical protein
MGTVMKDTVVSDYIMVLMLFNDKNYVHVLVCLTVIRAPEQHGEDDSGTPWNTVVDSVWTKRIRKLTTDNNNPEAATSVQTNNNNTQYKSVVNKTPTWNPATKKKWSEGHFNRS